MGQTERLYRIQRLLLEKGLVRGQEFIDALEVSRATFRRDLDYLRDRLGAPIVWDRERRGYVLDTTPGSDPRQLVPGLWLTEGEIRSLLSILELLGGLDPVGLIGLQAAPLRQRLERLLADAGHSLHALRERIRILPMGRRAAVPGHFQEIVRSLLARRRLRVRHFGRHDGAISIRELSPQRLVYYRDNWYLDAFCHLRDDLRCFSVDALEAVEELDKPAVSLDCAVVQARMEASYGIFAGSPVGMARLRFSAFRARWVVREVWHPQQRGQVQDDGSYVLELPYADDRELLRDILSQGREVEVLDPPQLRARLREELQAMLSRTGAP